MVNILHNSSSQEQGDKFSKICSIWEICPIIVCSKYDYGLTLTCFMTISNLVNQAFLYKKVQTVVFLSIAAFDLKSVDADN